MSHNRAEVRSRDTRADAESIWRAGVRAVESDRLTREQVSISDGRLRVSRLTFDLAQLGRVLIVGAGKAGAGMVLGVEEALAPLLREKGRVSGWVNVPADCLRPTRAIHLHPARAAGSNEPTSDGVAGSEAILRAVAGLGPLDLCLCLISGGASALLPAPAPGVSLADKLAVTRFLSAAGANIAELNAVRKRLSRIKGGGLARACKAGQLVALVISDVLGDPLEVIASGPTVESSGTAEEALAILERFDAKRGGVPQAVFDYLQRPAEPIAPTKCRVENIVIGNLAVAVDAAGVEAERLGYAHALIAARELEGDAEDVGRRLARNLLSMLRDGGPTCLVSGGEPVVKLCPPESRGRGGRNQQLVLAALLWLAEHARPDEWPRLVLLSGGTDGEDGPTDAAGAILTGETLLAVSRDLAAARRALERNDAYPYFDSIGALFRTGPTHTNVCDVRVAMVGPAGT